MFWLQRSTIKWLKLGDRNTRFFHASTLQWRQPNRISQLMRPKGWIKEDNQIRQHVNVYFVNLFTTAGSRSFEFFLCAVPRCITEQMNEKLCSPLSDKEIGSAAFQLGKLKAPGLDGFSSCFFFSK